MKIIIDIPEEAYNTLLTEQCIPNGLDLEYLVMHGTPLPKGHRWIPVSERLPEDRRTVLVTAYWHETYQVMEASYYGDGLWWCVPFNNCGEHMQKLKPIAWMPLPEPYVPDINDGKMAESEDKE